MKLSTYIQEIAYIPKAIHNLYSGDAGDLEVRKIKYGTNPRQYLLHCKPRRPVTKEKVLSFVHGGGWTLGRPERYVFMVKQLCRLGYEVYMPTYRVLPFYKFEDQRADTFAANKVIYSELKGQNRPLVIIGTSAGSHLSALMLFDEERRNEEGLPNDFFSGFVSISGPLDINQLPDTPVLLAFAGPRSKPRFQEANPLAFMSGNFSIPILMVHGTTDAIVPAECAQSFYKHAQAMDVGPVELHLLDGLTHLQISTAWADRETRAKDLVFKWLETYG